MRISYIFTSTRIHFQLLYQKFIEMSISLSAKVKTPTITEVKYDQQKQHLFELFEWLLESDTKAQILLKNLHVRSSQSQPNRKIIF